MKKQISKQILIESGSNPHLLEILRQENDPAYKKWVEEGSPTGNAGVIIYAEKFEIKPNRQVSI